MPLRFWGEFDSLLGSFMYFVSKNIADFCVGVDVVTGSLMCLANRCSSRAD
jgi:hypothetical protein